LFPHIFSPCKAPDQDSDTRSCQIAVCPQYQSVLFVSRHSVSHDPGHPLHDTQSSVLPAHPYKTNDAPVHTLLPQNKMTEPVFLTSSSFPHRADPHLHRLSEG